MNQSSKRRQDRIIGGIGILGLILTLLSVMGPSEPRQVSQRVEAESFILRDSAGKIRGELSTRIDQSPKLWLYDEAGVRRVELSLLADGTPGLRLLDRDEHIRAAFGVVQDEPTLSLRDQGQDRAKLILLRNGEPSLFLRDKGGHAIWSSPSIPATH
ncbi:MAG: hypothetical protein ICV76_05150 [Nitrospiraceae bacterium]|nr:hypothetical protein [Nitrospiraceae bacterium]